MRFALDAFEVPTSIGPVRFEDLLRLRSDGEQGKADETTAWYKAFLRPLVATQPSFKSPLEVCQVQNQDLKQYLEEENQRVKGEVGSGTRPAPPTSAEWEDEVKGNRAAHRPPRSFRNLTFRLSVRGAFFGSWTMSNNGFTGNVSGRTQYDSLPGPCMTTILTDLGAWHELSGEIIAYMLRHWRFELAGPPPAWYDLDTATWPNLQPAEESVSRRLRDVLDANMNVTYDLHSPGRVRTIRLARGTNDGRLTVEAHEVDDG